MYQLLFMPGLAPQLVKPLDVDTGISLWVSTHTSQSAKSVSEEWNIPRANACLTPTQKSETLINDLPQKFTISAASQIKDIIQLQWDLEQFHASKKDARS